jgi:hypothetical protein
MKRMAPNFTIAAVSGALLACAAANAQDAPLGPKPGPETEALKVIAHDMIFHGHIVPGMLWKGSPQVPANGYWKCDWILGGMWASCYTLDIIGPAPDGKGPLADGRKWPYTVIQHFGWDVEAKSYRYVGIDNEGGSYSMPGRLEGNKFIFEAPDYRTTQGIQQKFRFTWDFTDPNAIKFAGDNLVKGDPVWKPMEISTYIPTNLPR